MEWFLATEDLLSSALASKLLGHCFRGVKVLSDLGLEGNAKLRRHMESQKYHELSHRYPILVLTDLDRHACAPSLKGQWCSGMDLPPNLFFRIVVKEAEAWLLADHEGFSSLSGVSKGKIPALVESLPSPKEKLLELIRKHGNREIKSILPRPGSASRISPSYNTILVECVRNQWDPGRAARRSPSLHKAMQRLMSFPPK